MRIESIPAFSTISAYKRFINPDNKKKYAGLNDQVLLSEMKNDSFINRHHIDYIEVSKKYLEVSKAHIKAQPLAYLQNVLQSAIIFFTPATRYSIIEDNSRKIKYYDLIYSFNLSELAVGKQERRIALTISAIPKMLLYLIVFFVWIRSSWRKKNISSVNLIMICTIAFVFVVSSLLEHYENMRFRFEIEPLFLLLVGQILDAWIQRKKMHPADLQN